jgi:hypothetical protein
MKLIQPVWEAAVRGNQTWALAQARSKVLQGHRAAEKISLEQVDACSAQQTGLFVRLHAFGGDANTKPACKQQYRGYYRVTINALFHSLRERTIDLNPVEWKFRKIAQ